MKPQNWPRQILKLTDRKSTRLNSSHLVISYAVFCLKKKKNHRPITFGARLRLVGRCARCAVALARMLSPSPASTRRVPPLVRSRFLLFFFFFKDPAPTEFYPLPLPDALPICSTILHGNLKWARGRAGANHRPAAN